MSLGNVFLILNTLWFLSLVFYIYLCWDANISCKMIYLLVGSHIIIKSKRHFTFQFDLSQIIPSCLRYQAALHQPLGLAKHIAIYPRLRRDLVVVATSNKVRKLLDLWWRDVQHIVWVVLDDTLIFVLCIISIVVRCLQWLSTDYTFEYAWHSDLFWISLVCVFASGLELFCVLTTTCFDLQSFEVDQKTQCICNCLLYSLICRNKDIHFQKRTRSLCIHICCFLEYFKVEGFNASLVC